MNSINPSLEQVKEETRWDALEKEVQRLKAVSQKQSDKLHRSRKTFLFLLLFFVVLLTMLTLYGFIQWPEKSTPETSKENTMLENKDPAHLAPTPQIEIPDSIEDGIIFKIPANGILFSVQIGAFANIELTQYELNSLSMRQYSYDGINQFSAGLFADYQKATDFLSLIKQMGFSDAFIIATHYGKRLSLQEALKKQHQ